MEASGPGQAVSDESGWGEGRALSWGSTPPPLQDRKSTVVAGAELTSRSHRGGQRGRSSLHTARPVAPQSKCLAPWL